ncbi:MAG: hypothetical protein PWQ55_1571 [Chloroflexota bacterium]|nr:hypothetical protein [Chloroflexota bacterium]
MAKLQKTRPLGKSGLTVPALGVGTNKWHYGQNDASVEAAFKAAVDAGAAFFDTAEVYGKGNSERLLGKYLPQTDQQVVIATKYFRAPFHSLRKALNGSLERLGIPTVDLYYVHFPFGNIERLMDQMARAYEAGKIRAVGVSNYSAEQMRRAAERLARHNIPLAANQVEYSLLDRDAEFNGVLDACRELDAALVAYRPLSRGRLVSEGSADGQDSTELEQTLQRIADQRGKSVNQVTLNWLLRRDEHIIPIPGSTNAAHVADNAEALKWELSDEEFDQIDRASAPSS